jgi:hypothetical protein
LTPQLLLWTEQEIETREMLAAYFVRRLKLSLTQINNQFRFVRIETPVVDSKHALRKEMASGTHAASRTLLNRNAEMKYKLPLVIWQQGKIFLPDGHDGYRETTHLEFQLLFSNTTAVDYMPLVKQTCSTMLTIADAVLERDDSIMSCTTDDTLAQFVERSDLWYGKSIEIAIDMDACLLAFNENERYGRLTTSK